MTVHKHAFSNSNTNELIIGCYCIECDSFDGNCNLRFNQNSKYETRSNLQVISPLPAVIKSLKLFSVTINLNLADLPGIDSLEELEITNAKKISLPTGNDVPISAQNLVKFTYKNNMLSSLSSLIKILNQFKNLKYLILSQNSLTQLSELVDLAASKYLIELNIEHNSLREFAKLNGFLNLKILNLHKNQIVSLKDHLFENMPSLEVLDLSHNRLNSLKRNAFSGLTSLKQLLLSNNPFKSFDPDTFKPVAGLQRLDLISNSDVDWFTFDNSDICLLAHFRECGLIKININAEQSCNCFVKYINFISSNSDPNSLPDNCKYDNAQYRNLNKFFEEMNRYYFDQDLTLDMAMSSTGASGVSSLFQQGPDATSFENFKNTCMSNHLTKCDNISSTCINKVLLSVNSGHKADSTNHDKVINYNSAKLNSKEFNEPNYESENNRFKQNSWSSFLVDNFKSENSFLIILIAFLVIFVISSASLLIGVYLIVKRSKYNAYQMTENGYPNDER